MKLWEAIIAAVEDGEKIRNREWVDGIYYYYYDSGNSCWVDKNGDKCTTEFGYIFGINENWEMYREPKQKMLVPDRLIKWSALPGDYGFYEVEG